MVSIDQLRALATLKETGSFSKTGEALHKAQSAVTYAIKSLESELGVALLDRSGYRAVFTPAGEAILHKAQQMLDLAGDIDGLALSLKEGWEPRINIVTHALLPINNIMPLLSESLSSKYPTQLSLRVEILSGVTESIKLIQPDIVVTPLDSVEVPRNYDAVTIGSIDLIPVVSRDHQLAKLDSPISLTTLRKHVHLIVSDSARSPKQLDFLVVGAEEQYNLQSDSKLMGWERNFMIICLGKFLIVSLKIITFIEFWQEQKQ